MSIFANHHDGPHADETPTAKTFGPQQQRTARTLATHLWGWGVDIFQAAEQNDVERVAELAAAISANAIELSRLAKRASR